MIMTWQRAKFGVIGGKSGGPLCLVNRKGLKWRKVHQQHLQTQAAHRWSLLLTLLPSRGLPGVSLRLAFWHLGKLSREVGLCGLDADGW